MTTLKTPDEIANQIWNGGAKLTHNDLDKIITEDRQAIAQVLYDLLEGETSPRPDYLHFLSDEEVHILEIEREAKNRIIKKAQALIRQTLDPISNQE